jgi:hypothetical protein
MQVPAVGFYCAVVERFNPLVSTRMIAARETQVVFDRLAEGLRTRLGALNLGSVDGRQRKPESGAAGLMGVNPQPSSMRIDDRTAYRQANSYSTRLGGVEGFEYPLAILRCDAGPRVADRDEQAFRRARFGADQ